MVELILFVDIHAFSNSHHPVILVQTRCPYQQSRTKHKLRGEWISDRYSGAGIAPKKVICICHTAFLRNTTIADANEFALRNIEAQFLPAALTIRATSIAFPYKTVMKKFEFYCSVSIWKSWDRKDNCNEVWASTIGVLPQRFWSMAPRSRGICHISLS